MYERAGKRALDVVLSGAALVLLSPIMLVTAALVRAEDGGPAIFRQRRTGASGQPFVLLKFRSMPVGTADRPSADAGTLAVTRVGRVIRRLNIDELPQLLNVMRGDMSLVGPRPALPTQSLLIAERARGRAGQCRPGLTGLAQVNGFDGMSVEAKAAFDEQYAERMTLLRDLAIIARTFAYLLKRPPVY